MRLLTAFIAILAATMAHAQPGQPEAAIELKIFLEQMVRAEQRVLNFAVLGQEEVGPVRRAVRYEARVEFPVGVDPAARALLANENVTVVEGNLDEPSSRKLVIDLRREAKFIHTQRGWVAQVGTTRYPVSRPEP